MRKSLVYAGTDDGVVVVSLGGNTSSRVGQSIKGWPVMKVVADPDQPHVVFAGTRGDGVWRSDDAGATWCKPSYGKRGPGKVQSLAFHAGTLYAGGEPIDLYTSDDRGASWRVVDSMWDVPFVRTVTYPVSTVEPHVRDIAVDPEDPSVIYLALQVGYMVKSLDGGTTWQLLDHGLDADVHTIAVNPRHPGELLIATGGHDSRGEHAPGKALYRSEDGGVSWSPTALEFYQEYSIPVVRDTQTPDLAYAALARGYDRLWNRPSGAEGVVIRSEDGGRTWKALETGQPDASRLMAVTMAAHASEPNVVVAAFNNGDLLLSQDAGDSWQKLDVSLPGVNDVKVVPA
jgi:photosystem II stability/assembly factor-like uncharacterized protein